MRPVRIPAVLALSVAANGKLLYSNGPFVTHPGACAAGADVRLTAVAPSSAGRFFSRVHAGPRFRLADNFVVPSGGWTSSEIVTYGYSSGAPAGAPLWTAFSLTVWSGPPSISGTPLFSTAAAPQIDWTAAYRVFNNPPAFLDTQPAVNSLRWSLPDLFLTPGEYWLDVQVAGAIAAWNVVMDVNPAAPDDPITRAGDARQPVSATEWRAATTVAVPFVNVALPFEVLGVPACAGTRADADCSGVVDFFDIDPFLMAIFQPAACAAVFCGGSTRAADVDASGAVDFFAIDPFTANLFGP